MVAFLSCSLLISTSRWLLLRRQWEQSMREKMHPGAECGLNMCTVWLPMSVVLQMRALDQECKDGEQSEFN